MISIILAGGLGKRMNSDLPKVLHRINDKPMIFFVIQNAIRVGSKKILIVVGKYRDIIQHQIEEYFPKNDIFEYIDQPQALGTGHAIQCCMPYFTSNHIPKSTSVLILSGDVPMLHHKTLSKLSLFNNSVLITNSENPHGCGRIIFGNRTGTMKKIVEEKDCTTIEKNIKYINCGIYHASVDTLLRTIPHIQNKNASSEYYLTDFIEIALKSGIKIQYYELPREDQYQVMNINTTEQLLDANIAYSTHCI